MSSLAELYVRPIPKAVLAEWERARNAYEREVRNAKPKAFAIVRRVSPPPAAKPNRKLCACGCGCGIAKDNLSGWRRGHRPKKVARHKIAFYCQCGCGEIIEHSQRVYLPRHRVNRGTRRSRPNEIAEQLSRITDPLALKVLLKELGRTRNREAAKRA